ncbi:MAG: hypothetical protein H3C41_01045 [Bacteroidales bacterium]|nr:hypothetical protein [Bacteroidales bacterium]
MVTKPIADGWMLKTLWQRISLTIWVMLFFVLGLPFVSYAVPEKEHFSERQYNSFIQDKLRCDNDMQGCFDLLTVETQILQNPDNLVHSQKSSGKDITT